MMDLVGCLLNMNMKSMLHGTLSIAATIQWNSYITLSDNTVR
jgi:hypothetical protein